MSVQPGELTRLDVERIRADFPILAERVHGKPLAYLDNGATTQKPARVIDTIADYYRTYNSNIHRGVHALSQRATEAYEGARERLARFLGASSPGEVVYTRGTTDAINLVAQGYLRPRLEPGDEILISHIEHHSNIVPWQLLRETTGCVLRVAPVNDRGELELDRFEALLGDRTRLVSIGHVSNALGTIHPVREVIDLAHARGVPVLLDGAQAVAHLPVDVRALDCDFYAISGHKMYGPTGIGALWGRRELLESMDPVQGGGDMILAVTFEKTRYNRLPYRLEAGTPHIAGAIGLGAAVDYLESAGRDAICAWESALLERATERLSSIDRLQIIGTAREKAAIVSFVLDGVHPHDAGTILDQEGIAVRAGHHCAQPALDLFGVPATVRASFGLYNTFEEIDRLVEALEKVREIFR